MSTHEGHVETVNVKLEKIEGSVATITISTYFMGLSRSDTYTVNVGDTLTFSTRVTVSST